MNDVCCAHSKIVLKHIDYPGGTRSDYWECDSGCGKKFLPESTDMNIRNLRDYFAAQALTGYICLFVDSKVPVEQTAKRCYEFADAMLDQRGKGKEE